MTVTAAYRSAPGGLVATLAAAADVDARAAARAGTPDGAGWVPLDRLADPEHFAVAVGMAAAFYGHDPADGDCPPVLRSAAASLFAGDVAGAVARPLVAALIGARRVPLLSPGAVRVHFGALGADEIALDPPSGGAPAVAVLAGDDLAGAADTVVVADLAELRRAAAAGFAATVAPLVSAASGIGRRGPRTMWAEIAERISAAVLLSCRAAGRPHDAPAEARALLAAGPAPLRVRLDWVDVPLPVPEGEPAAADVGTHPWKRRRVCCLAYQTPRFAGQLCATCPKVTRDETVHRMADWMRTQAAG